MQDIVLPLHIPWPEAEAAGLGAVYIFTALKWRVNIARSKKVRVWEWPPFFCEERAALPEWKWTIIFNAIVSPPTWIIRAVDYR